MLSSYISLAIILKAIMIPLIVVLLIWISEFYLIEKTKFSLSKFSFKELILWVIHYTPVSNIGALISSFGVFYLVKKIIKGFHFNFFDNLNQSQKVIIFIILIDLFGYIVHYLLHKIDFLWHFHQFHHSAESFNIITANRVHFFEVALVKFTHTSIFVFLGGDFELFKWYYVSTVLLGHLKHSNFKFNYPGFIKFLIQSPAHHWVHHSTKQEHNNKNFGEIFQIWDTIFKTGHNPSTKELETISIGTSETKNISNSYTELFIYPYKIAFNNFILQIRFAFKKFHDKF